MYRYFEYNIHLLFLPPYILYVLQSLDLSVFSPLKGAYRKQLSNLSLLTDSILLGKRNFLYCYHRARIESLTAHNIKISWKVIGLWPRNMTKLFMSCLLLENNNNSAQPAQINLIEEVGLV
jgi:hypothetical protein